MDWMRSGLISSLATPWPDGASVAGLAAGSRLAGMGLGADFFAAFFAECFFAKAFFAAVLVVDGVGFAFVVLRPVMKHTSGLKPAFMLLH
jgi:hypothetical protein